MGIQKGKKAIIILELFIFLFFYLFLRPFFYSFYAVRLFGSGRARAGLECRKLWSRAIRRPACCFGHSSVAQRRLYHWYFFFFSCCQGPCTDCHVSLQSSLSKMSAWSVKGVDLGCKVFQTLAGYEDSVGDKGHFALKPGSSAAGVSELWNEQTATRPGILFAGRNLKLLIEASNHIVPRAESLVPSVATPTVLLVLVVEEQSAYLPVMLKHLAALDYPAASLHLQVALLGRSRAALHQHIVADWLQQHPSRFASTTFTPFAHPFDLYKTAATHAARDRLAEVGSHSSIFSLSPIKKIKQKEREPRQSKKYPIFFLLLLLLPLVCVACVDVRGALQRAGAAAASGAGHAGGGANAVALGQVLLELLGLVGGRVLGAGAGSGGMPGPARRLRCLGRLRRVRQQPRLDERKLQAQVSAEGMRLGGGGGQKKRTQLRIVGPCL